MKLRGMTKKLFKRKEKRVEGRSSQGPSVMGWREEPTDDEEFKTSGLVFLDATGPREKPAEDMRYVLGEDTVRPFDSILDDVDIQELLEECREVVALLGARQTLAFE